MIINRLLDNRFPLLILGFHLILGVASAFSYIALAGWLYAFLLFTLPGVIMARGRDLTYLNYIIIYASAMEILARMAGSAPIIPHEWSKYLMFVLLLVGIVKGRSRANVGWVMLVLLIPGTLIDKWGAADFGSLVFNFLGPLNLALAIVYFKGQVISMDEFIQMLRFLFYPMVSVLAFTVFKTPAIQESQFDLISSFAFSAGYGPNQVSTALGLGAFITFVFWFSKCKLSGNRLIDMGIFFLFSFQGLLTFSRGGVMGAALGIVVILYIIVKSSRRQRRIFKVPTFNKYALPVIIIGIASFYIVDNLTQGTLLLRYQGETAGTMVGGKERDLNTISAERWNIILGDLQLWNDNLLFGSGVGSSRYLRERAAGMSPHVEMSRLLAEHGFFGFIYFFIWLYLGIMIYRSKGDPLIKGVMMALFLIAMFTSFHAATRTFVTPLLGGMSMLQIYYDPKNYLHR